MLSAKERIEEIIKEFNEKVLPDIKNNISGITSGGCGFFALALWDRLKEIGIENVTCRPFLITDNLFGKNYNSPDDLNIFIKSNGMDNNHNSWIHLLIEIKEDENQTFLVDGESIRPFYNEISNGEITNYEDLYVHIGDPISYEELKQLFNFVNWNEEFDQNQIPKLKKILQEDLV